MVGHFSPSTAMFARILSRRPSSLCSRSRPRVHYSIPYVRHNTSDAGSASSSTSMQIPSSPKEFTVVLDGETLDVNQKLAKALGWNPDTGVAGVGLNLSGWAPHYFAVTRAGTDSGKSSNPLIC